MTRMKDNVILPESRSAHFLQEAVLFGFDDQSFPYQQFVQKHLIPGQAPKLVLDHGPKGSHDEFIRFYGTVLQIDGVFHMWYYGDHGQELGIIGYGHGLHERKRLCYARSGDGLHWEKPSLGFVEFGGSSDNNLVDFPEPSPRPAAAILYEPDEPNPARRFKMAYEADREGKVTLCVAFSPDGLRWAPFEHNPVGSFFEMSGIAKFNGMYYVTGQDSLSAHRPFLSRKLVTYASKDFETWSPCAAVGLDRSPDETGPRREREWNNHEEVHVGAALWNRGNVLVGVYGQWHGHPTGDRRHVGIDLGLTLSHDGVRHVEPLPGFKLVPAREQPGSPFDTPSLMQGQGMENVGGKTYYWYSLWKGTEGTGVRMVSWDRDRLGMLKPFRSAGGRAVSCPIALRDGGEAQIFVNASGLGAYSQLRISLVDEGFRPLPGYSGDDAAILDASGLRTEISWGAGGKLASQLGVFRLQIEFEGIRGEDGCLHAVYVAGV